MADLTPPASTHNTPQRNIAPSNPPDPEVVAPASPTSVREGSAAPIEGSEATVLGAVKDTTNLEVGAAEQVHHPSSGGMDVDETGAGGSETEEEKDEKAGDGIGEGMTAEEDTAAVDGTTAKGKDTKKAGKKGKEDLYESEIVQRWNKEFGDVCLAPPAKA